MAKTSANTIVMIFIALLGLGAVAYIGFTEKGKMAFNNFMHNLRNLGRGQPQFDPYYSQPQPRSLPFEPEGMPDFPIPGLSPEQIRLLHEIATNKEAREDIRDWTKEYNESLEDWAKDYAKQYEI